MFSLNRYKEKSIHFEVHKKVYFPMIQLCSVFVYLQLRTEFPLGLIISALIIIETWLLKSTVI